MSSESAAENDMVNVDRINQLFEDGLLKDIVAIETKQIV
jgi:hypothetical protein